MAKLEVERTFEVPFAADTIYQFLLDVEQLPVWSGAHKAATIVERYDDGKPKLVEVTVTAAGLTDTEVMAYTWGDNELSWELSEPTKLVKQQKGRYVFTPKGDKTDVHFHLAGDITAPLPGLVMKQASKKAAKDAESDLRQGLAAAKK